MNVRLFVEIVTVLTDVVQGGEDGRVIPTPTLVWHPSIPFTGGRLGEDCGEDLCSPADDVPRILGDQREERVICWTG